VISSGISCDLGSVGANSTATVTIQAIPNNSGRITNSGVVSINPGASSAIDPNILDNEDGVTVSVADPSSVYSISGTFLNAQGLPVPEARITLTGPQDISVLTNSTGAYSFTNLPSGGYYTVTASKYGYEISPSSRSIVELNSDSTISFIGSLTSALSKNADFDGDGKTDISVFRPGDGNWYMLRSNTNSTGSIQWGVSTDIVTPGDFDGDKQTDFSVWRSSGGLWYILTADLSGYSAYQWGVSTDIPMSGDYDGDGKTDIVVWRPSNGTWYVYRSSDGELESYTWGEDGDIPISGDFDGDHRSDYIIFRPSEAKWYIHQSTLGDRIVPFGQAGDILLPMDYDGDGTSDFGVFRPSNGHWLTAPSQELNPSQNFSDISWGQAGDVPTPGDYDGDGKADLAVYRPDTGYWWVFKSSDLTYYAVGFGVSSDQPIPRQYFH
jgi:hypothetical protein